MPPCLPNGLAIICKVKDRTALSFCFLIPALNVALFAQVVPKLEIFGGYSYYRLPEESDSGLTAANLNGWNASAKVNLRSRISVVVDFGGNYGERRMLPTQFQTRETKPGSYRQHTFLIGPEVRVFANDRLTVNVHALIGGTSVGTLVLPLQEPFQPPPDLLGNTPPPVTEFRLGWEKPVTGAFGGSIDYRISDRLSYRILQPDLVVTHLGGLNWKNLRLSTGVVFTFGML
jgi:hypothetical protein